MASHRGGRRDRVGPAPAGPTDRSPPTATRSVVAAPRRRRRRRGRPGRRLGAGLVRGPVPGLLRGDGPAGPRPRRLARDGRGPGPGRLRAPAPTLGRRPGPACVPAPLGRQRLPVASPPCLARTARGCRRRRRSARAIADTGRAAATKDVRRGGRRGRARAVRRRRGPGRRAGHAARTGNAPRWCCGTTRTCPTPRSPSPSGADPAPWPRSCTEGSNACERWLTMNDDTASTPRGAPRTSRPASATPWPRRRVTSPSRAPTGAIWPGAWPRRLVGASGCWPGRPALALVVGAAGRVLRCGGGGAGGPLGGTSAVQGAGCIGHSGEARPSGSSAGSDGGVPRRVGWFVNFVVDRHRVGHPSVHPDHGRRSDRPRLP